jgi:hypothetical protein
MTAPQTDLEQQFTASVAAAILNAPDDDDEETARSDAGDGELLVDVEVLRVSAEGDLAEAGAKLGEAASADEKATAERAAADKEHASRVERLEEARRALETIPVDASEAQVVKLVNAVTACEKRIKPAADELAGKTAAAKAAADAHDAVKRAREDARLAVEVELPMLALEVERRKAEAAWRARDRQVRREIGGLEDKHPRHAYDVFVRWGLDEGRDPRVELSVRDKEMMHMRPASVGGSPVLMPFGAIVNIGGTPGARRPDDVLSPPPVAELTDEAKSRGAHALLLGVPPGQFCMNFGVHMVHHGGSWEAPLLKELHAMFGLPPPAEPEAGSTSFPGSSVLKGLLQYTLSPGGPLSNWLAAKGTPLSVEAGRLARGVAPRTPVEFDNMGRPLPPKGPPMPGSAQPATMYTGVSMRDGGRAGSASFRPPLPPHVALQRARALEPQIVSLRALGRDEEADKAEAELLVLRAQASTK